MRSLHLTIVIFCQLILASYILHLYSVSATPIVQPKSSQPVLEQPSVSAPKSPVEDPIVKHNVAVQTVKHQAPVAVPEPQQKAVVPELGKAAPQVEAKSAAVSEPQYQKATVVELQVPSKKCSHSVRPVQAEAAHMEPLQVKNVEPAVKPAVVHKEPVAAPKPEAMALSARSAEINHLEKPMEKPAAVPVAAPAPVEQAKSPLQEKSMPVVSQDAPAVPVDPVVPPSSHSGNAPIVKGGQGPLHLLAATLCSYQPERPVADETLNLLYSQRAALRKSLFEFMSLKFTNLEKLSSKLNAGLEVMPRKTTDPSQSSVVPSHGWPVVGKCTAHDLKLMAEAAWCECNEESTCGGKQMASRPANVPSYLTVENLDKQEPKIVGNKHQRRSTVESANLDQSSAVVSKMLHVNDVKEAPLVDSSLAANLGNLTQQQLLASQAQQAQGNSRACRLQALRMTKALFNHLAEDQRNVSESWPKLYAQVADDECARKRMIDVVTALSGFRGESTSIRRDNVEFAFAMDDLRTKVLESEVNVPLTFDKQFIEVEQFLQQSVKLMLANIDPERAKLTSMRYRSLMAQPMSSDDQCIELHQRLLAKNYPTDCNPIQFGQLPDVLRMAANSLELWSIEKELSKHSAKIAAEYPMVSPPPKQEVNECIANLVSS